MGDKATLEGELQLNWSGGLNEKWRQTFEAAFDREFAIHVGLRQAASSALPAAGQTPTWDVLIGSAEQAGDLARGGLLARQEWSKLFGAPAQAVLFDGGSLAFAQQIVRPAYNTKRVPQGTAPASWEGLLEARWKGRLGVSSAVDVWADLSSSWGDQRASRFVAGLAAQQPLKGTPSELEQKLEDGAIDVLAAVDDRRLRAAKDRAAAVAAAEVQPLHRAAAVAAAEVQPLLLQSLTASPLPASAHPNAAILFAGFLITQEGQQLWQDYAGQSSIHVPGSPSQQLVQGKQYVLADPEFVLRDRPARAAKYAKTLGY